MDRLEIVLTEIEHNSTDANARATARAALAQIDRTSGINLNDDLHRFMRGVQEILQYLEQDPPRVGDAEFICEALLAK